MVASSALGSGCVTTQNVEVTCISQAQLRKQENNTTTVYLLKCAIGWKMENRRRLWRLRHGQVRGLKEVPLGDVKAGFYANGSYFNPFRKKSFLRS